MLNVALIGAGYIADCHISAYGSMQEEFVKVTAVVDNNPVSGQSAAGKANCKWFPTLDEAVAAVPVDVVDICVPTFLHEQYAVKAAQMGKHVLCEKPVTLTLDSFDRMNSACAEAGVKFMTAQVVRFFPEFVQVRRTLEQGILGKLHMFSEKRLAQHPAWSSWHRDPGKSGGGLFDLNAHDIDYIYSLFGLPKQIHAIGWRSDTGCWNHVVTTMQWENMQAVCETSLEMTGDYPFTVGVRVVGDKGTLEHCSSAGANIKEKETVNSLTIYPQGGTAQLLDPGTDDPFYKELHAFMTAVAEDAAVPIPPEETRDVLRMLLATKESLESGAPVCLR